MSPLLQTDQAPVAKDHHKAQHPCTVTPGEKFDIIQEKLALAITVFDYARVTLMADGHMDPPYSIHAL